MSRNDKFILNRREFIKGSLAGITFFPSLGYPLLDRRGKKKRKAKIALIKTHDRKDGVRKAMELLHFPPVRGKKVLIKPNFNTADPHPGSTHNETLTQIVFELRGRGASEITVGDRSGPPETKRVLEEKGIFGLAKELEFKIINFEELEDKDWVHFNPAGNHWSNGFFVPRCVTEAEYIVSTCCLKTHQFGGVFTLSLKLSVGVTPKTLMRELHRSPDMRKMIAEINLGYKPQLIILDGVEAFVDGGPSKGTKKQADVFIAGDDRVAVDAAGLAVLKELGSNKAIMESMIFEQEQISRAVELDLGVSRPDQVEFVTPDKPSREYARRLKSILALG